MTSSTNTPVQHLIRMHENHIRRAGNSRARNSWNTRNARRNTGNTRANTRMNGFAPKLPGQRLNGPLNRNASFLRSRPVYSGPVNNAMRSKVLNKAASIAGALRQFARMYKNGHTGTARSNNQKYNANLQPRRMMVRAGRVKAGFNVNRNARGVFLKPTSLNASNASENTTMTKHAFKLASQMYGKNPVS